MSFKQHNSKTIIIAEAGVNHNGSLALAKKLVDAAVAAKVDFVKFQTFQPEMVVSKYAVKAEYQIENTGTANETQYEMIKKLQLSDADHFELKAYCAQKNIGFFSTGFDIPSLHFLNDKMELSFFKIPSGEITNLPYLRTVAAFGKPVILSTGMANLSEIGAALSILQTGNLKKEDITVLHCNTEYPTPMSDVNIKAMLGIQREFDVNIGYSDHTQGIEIPIAAVAMGATVIEKHFTLDKNMAGPDHKASLEPHELIAMVAAIRNIEQAMAGDGIKQASLSETKNIDIARKSIIALTDIKAGEVFTTENLTCKRPGNGVSPMLWDSVIGQVANHDFLADELIRL
jgi:N,N'-diacetyllegionaminate synthase